MFLSAALLTVAVPAAAQTAPADAASAADIRAKVAAMAARMGNATFAYEPLVRDGETVAALEYWKAPGKPAVHPDEAEYALVIEGAGTLVSGGTMADAKETQPGLVEGSRIDGGVTRRLGPGDVLLVPAGVPHWFGIDGKLVLLGIKLPKK
ncbi:cupin domain-containing protein [Sphingomonas sp. ac-8]|uniref:cupin domain-containing protein n=1 Tax=Sphingomonas sp. ac-8 TaxID=3242977 RepID=UPI003A80D4F4